MSAELGTTNLLLGIMAAVSVLEALVIIGMGVAGFMVYKKVMVLVDQGMVLAQGIEARQVAPAMLRVNAILDDVKGVTSTVRQGTGHLDGFVDWILDRIGRKRRRASGEHSDRVM